jgi:Aminotransferase class I and II
MLPLVLDPARQAGQDEHAVTYDMCWHCTTLHAVGGRYCILSPAHDLRYLPIAGYKPFINSAVQLALGDDSQAIKENRVAAIQSLSGTGACRIMAEFMHRFMPGCICCQQSSNHTHLWPAMFWVWCFCLAVPLSAFQVFGSVVQARRS